MADDTVLVSLQQLKPIRIVKWKVGAGCAVSIGRVILLYDVDGVQAADRCKLKSSQAGTVHELLAPEGAVVRSGEPLLRLRACVHPMVMKDMCAECGADLRREDTSRSASVPMVHAIPELKVSEEVAQKLGRADGERLIRDRKLVLLVDLDQTLIHTTNDNIPVNLKDVYHFQLYGPSSPWYHTRLRPGTHAFLSNISQFFELHICTFGARNYAHTIAMFLDTDQAYFANRILSRDECFDPTSKKANLRALFPCGDDMVCIIDDREDVWNHASNLIHVKPYHFFKHTGDINAPPGLDKHEADNLDGVDLTNVHRTKLNGRREKADADVREASKGESNGVAVSDAIDEDVDGGSVLKPTNGECTPEDTKQSTEEATSRMEDDNGEEKQVEVTASDDHTDAPMPAAAPDAKVQTPSESSSDKPKEATPDDGDDTDAKKPPADEEELVEIEDADDYLLYLEDILKLVHRRFYEEYDRLEAGRVPDLKVVIPTVRGEILKGCRLVFSGLVPTHVQLEQSKAYQVARSLGAIVTPDIDDASTHLVAVRPGTAKVNAGRRRRRRLAIVTPDWLWACAERWERIEEAIFPLSGKGSKNRHPPPHCSSPEHQEASAVASCPPQQQQQEKLIGVSSTPSPGATHDQPAPRKRTPSGRFMDTINPLMSFSSADIADMDKEVEDILDDATDSENDVDEEVEHRRSELASRLRNDDDDDDENDDEDDDEDDIVERSSSTSSTSSGSSRKSPSDDGLPRGFKRMRQASITTPVGVAANGKAGGERSRAAPSSATIDDLPSAKCRRSETHDSDANSNSSASDVEQGLEDEADDGEWNMMGAALEREFLSNN